MTWHFGSYWEQELAFLAESAPEFLRRYPAEAGRLLPDVNRVPDPHLDRMIQGFALLAGRIHKKLDDEFPFLTEALLDVTASHLTRPVPPMTIVQFDQPQGATIGPEGYHVPAGASLSTKPFGNPATPLTWRLGYPVDLWPISVTAAQATRTAPVGAPPRTQGALKVHLETRGEQRFDQLPLSRLRFHLNGEDQFIATLYEVLLHQATRAIIRDVDNPGRSFSAPASRLFAPVGLGVDEPLLPSPSESFPGYRLLTEFLSFPAKFHFVDLLAWDEIRSLGPTKRLEILVFLARLPENVEQGLSVQTLKLGCTPAINLFEKSAEPIAEDEVRFEYRVTPSRRNPMAMEVYSIEEVSAVDEQRSEPTEFRPFFQYYLQDQPGSRQAFWYAHRTPSEVDDDAGSEIDLFLYDPDVELDRPAGAVLDVRCLCTNRDYPAKFQRYGDMLTLSSDQPTPPGVIRCLRTPTPTLRPPFRRLAHWRLLATLTGGVTGLSGGGVGLENLQEIMRICDFSSYLPDSVLAAVNRQAISGLHELSTRPTVAPIAGPQGIHPARGTLIELKLDEKELIGTGAYLFSSVLDRFLGLHAGLNSFSQLKVRTIQGDLAKTWPPRSMDRVLS